MTTISPDLELAELVRAAVQSVNDPEYPDVSIVDLGLLESITAQPDGTVSIELIPTFSGCPALAMIAADVEEVVAALPSVASCRVTWLHSPVWSTGRISAEAKARLSTDYTVVLRRKDGGLRCPVCGSDRVEDQSSAGPTRCRSVAWCGECRNVVEVMR